MAAVDGRRVVMTTEDTIFGTMDGAAVDDRRVVMTTEDMIVGTMGGAPPIIFILIVSVSQPMSVPNHPRQVYKPESSRLAFCI